MDVVVGVRRASSQSLFGRDLRRRIVGNTIDPVNGYIFVAGLYEAGGEATFVAGLYEAGGEATQNCRDSNRGHFWDLSCGSPYHRIADYLTDFLLGYDGYHFNGHGMAR